MHVLSYLPKSCLALYILHLGCRPLKVVNWGLNFKISKKAKLKSQVTKYFYVHAIYILMPILQKFLYDFFILPRPPYHASFWQAWGEPRWAFRYDRMLFPTRRVKEFWRCECYTQCTTGILRTIIIGSSICFTSYVSSCWDNNYLACFRFHWSKSPW